ncbi:phosphatase PAP2 family protein [Streptomyces lannensis]|uniref:Phosphatase PAP2 family protein n=1 Tax=Streptomyces lannensis TaxID=766498 RepID=A0ABP7L1T9_9ACTN
MDRAAGVDVPLRDAASATRGHPRVLPAALPAKLYSVSRIPEPELEDPPAVHGGMPPLPGRPARVLGPLGLLFLLLSWQVAVRGPLVRVDERLGMALVRPSRISELLADLGSATIAVPLLVIVLTWVAQRGRDAGAHRWWLPPAAAAGLTAAYPVLILALKTLFARPGPPLMGPVTGFYPSGHTATAMIAYGAAALVLSPWLHTPQARLQLLAVWLTLNAGVAFGLVRSGYHWPLDVLGSWCLCAMLLYSLWLCLSRSSRRTSAGTPSSRTGPS